MQKHFTIKKLIKKKKKKKRRPQRKFISIEQFHKYACMPVKYTPFQLFNQRMKQYIKFKRKAENKYFGDVTLSELQTTLSHLNIQTKYSHNQLRNNNNTHNQLKVLIFFFFFFFSKSTFKNALHTCIIKSEDLKR